jgi:hypothetical protein
MSHRKVNPQRNNTVHHHAHVVNLPIPFVSSWEFRPQPGSTWRIHAWSFSKQSVRCWTRA